MEVIDYFLKQSTSIVGTIRKQRVGKWFGYDRTNEQCKVTKNANFVRKIITFLTQCANHFIQLSFYHDKKTASSPVIFISSDPCLHNKDSN